MEKSYEESKSSEKTQVNQEENKKQQNTVQQPDLRRLKRAWEKVRDHQANHSPFRRKARISSVKIVQDEKGQKAVEVQMSDGGKFNDVGDKRDLFVAMSAKKKPNLNQLMALVEAVRSFGFDSVAMGLPPELKRALLKACKQCGVSLKPQEKKKVKISSSSSSRKKEDSLLSFYKKPEQEQKPDHNAPYRLPLPDYPITSVKSLDMAVEEQKRLNRQYLQNRLKRCENEIKDEYFDQFRKQLKEIEIAIAEGKPLNQNQQMIKQFADTYGLKADKRQEKPNPEQAKARKKLEIKDLPEAFQKKMKERTEHYTSICNAKLMALDVKRNELQNDYFQNGTEINMSQLDLAKSVAALLPSAQDRNAQNMAQTMDRLNSALENSNAELKQTKRDYRTRAEQLLFQEMSPNPERAKPIKKRKRPEAILRKSYEENAPVQKTDTRGFSREISFSR